ncbi:MAG: hypothetical protein ACE5J2_08080, partial [Nitrososphaerales archaeon]
ASYWTTQKVYMDNGNWLIDGISNYITAKQFGEHGMIKDQLRAFIDEPRSFEWYGSGTPSQYGATYTLLKYLDEEYGESLIDKTLTHLASGMITNHRCSTLEQCSLLRAVYDASSLDINDKRYDLNFDALSDEWKSYAEHYILEELNEFQRIELERALANQNAGLPLTTTERAVLDLVSFFN